MAIVSVRRVLIHLGDIPLNVYRTTYTDGTSKDLLAGRNVTDAIDEYNASLKRTMRVDSLKDLPNADSSLNQIKADTGESFTPVSIKDAAFYWGKMAETKNHKATALLVACAIESIESRVSIQIQKEDCDNKEEQSETELVLQVINREMQSQIDELEEWFTVRDEARKAHKFFQSECKRHHYPAHKVHDELTLGIFGDTAEAARMKALVSGNLDPKIGLNHQENITGMKKLAFAKEKFASFRKGTWQEKSTEP